MKRIIALGLGMSVVLCGCSSLSPPNSSQTTPSKEYSSSQSIVVQPDPSASVVRDNQSALSKSDVQQTEPQDYSHLISSQYMIFPDNARIDRTFGPGITEYLKQESGSVSDLIIDQNKLVPIYELRFEDVKNNFDKISSQNKLTPFLVKTNEYSVITTNSAGKENGAFGFLYDETQNTFVADWVAFDYNGSIDYEIRRDLILNDQRKEKIEKSGIKVADAKVYSVILDYFAWGHIITDGTTEVFLCTYQGAYDDDLFEQIYSSKEIISLYQELLLKPGL